jgi:hypothetical protein
MHYSSADFSETVFNQTIRCFNCDFVHHLNVRFVSSLVNDIYMSYIALKTINLPFKLYMIKIYVIYTTLFMAPFRTVILCAI